VIAWDRVDELREEVGEEAFSEVVEMFLDEVEGVLTRLRGGPRAESLEGDLHFIKSSALTLGFARLSEICQAGERCARAAEWDKVDLGAVLAAYEASKAEFMGGLA
jgi:HPt (histidine-containing phosphotransfer) domain-containing protein